MDLILLGALATGIAVFSALTALMPSRARIDRACASAERLRGWRATPRGCRGQPWPGTARSPPRRRYLLISVAAPLVLATVGLLLSLPIAIAAASSAPSCRASTSAAWSAPRHERPMRTRRGSSARWSTGRCRGHVPRPLRAPQPRPHDTAGCAPTSRSSSAATTPTSRSARPSPRSAAARPAGTSSSSSTRSRSPSATHQPASAAGDVLGTLGEAARANRPIARSGGSREPGPAAPGGDPGGRHPRRCSSTSRRQPRAHGAGRSTRRSGARAAAGGGPSRGRRDRAFLARHAGWRCRDGARRRARHRARACSAC